MEDTEPRQAYASDVVLMRLRGEARATGPTLGAGATGGC
jgi:hypothetical protein